MAKVSISAKIETDIIKKLDNKAKAKGFSRSKYIAKILKDHALNLGGAGQSLMRFGKALDCPIFILPSNPKSAWVDISVCECQRCRKLFRKGKAGQSGSQSGEATN